MTDFKVMKFGLYLENNKVELVDLETGEILAENAEGVKQWLTSYDEYTLQIL